MTTGDRADLSVQFMRPSPLLEGLVSGYHVYSAGPLGSPVWEELFFPGWTNIRFTLIDGGWHCGPVGMSLEPVPQQSVFGPSSRGIYSRSNGGLMIGIGITPRGWHRFFKTPANVLADRILSLSSQIAAVPPTLIEDLRVDPSPDAIRHRFDDWLISIMRPPIRSDSKVAELFDWLATANETDVARTGSALGLSNSQLRRLALSNFGFPPKLLLRRSRFLKSITRIISQPDRNWSETIDESYFDYAHFVRDCQDFLGMAPRQFFALDRPMTRLSLAMRAKQLGAPLQGLHGSSAMDQLLPDDHD